MREKTPISERRACRLVGISRSVLAYQPQSDPEPLKGKVLEFALGVIEESRKGFSDSDFLLDAIARKLNAGQPLDDYENHIMVDVLLVHKRLSG